LEYIRRADELEGCVFCLAAAGDDDVEGHMRYGQKTP